MSKARAGEFFVFRALQPRQMRERSGFFGQLARLARGLAFLRLYQRARRAPALDQRAVSESVPVAAAADPGFPGGRDFTVFLAHAGVGPLPGVELPPALGKVELRHVERLRRNRHALAKLEIVPI